MAMLCVGIFAAQGNAYARKITKPTERAVYHNNRGVQFLEKGNLELAENEFKTAVELSPEYVEGYNNLGIVSKKKGDLGSARVYFEKAIALDKNYGAALSHLSMVYLDLGDMDKALSFGKSATRKGSTLPITHYNLGLVYLAMGEQKPDKNYDEFAENEFKIATELDPNMFEAHIALARLYKKQARYNLSAIRYRLALGNHPDDAEIWNELGGVYKLMGDNAKAENAFKKALSITKGGSGSSTPQMEIGAGLQEKKEYEKAIEELSAAVEADPTNAMTHFKLGSAYLEIGEADLAANKKADADKHLNLSIEPLKKALQLNPHMADAAYNLGLAYYRLGKTSESETFWLKAVGIDQSHARALYNLGILYHHQGNKAKAVQYLCRFAAASGGGIAAERENALNLVKADGGKCPN